jgi:cell division protease FtsH
LCEEAGLDHVQPTGAGTNSLQRREGTTPMNNKVSFSIWYILLAIMAVVFVHDFILALNKVEELPYSEFKKLVVGGKVAEVSVTNQVLTGKLKPEGESKEQKSFATVRVEDPDLVRELNQHGVTFTGIIESTFWRDLL